MPSPVCSQPMCPRSAAPEQRSWLAEPVASRPGRDRQRTIYGSSVDRALSRNRERGHDARVGPVERERTTRRRLARGETSRSKRRYVSRPHRAPVHRERGVVRAGSKRIERTVPALARPDPLGPDRIASRRSRRQAADRRGSDRFTVVRHEEAQRRPFQGDTEGVRIERQDDESIAFLELVELRGSDAGDRG